MAEANVKNSVVGNSQLGFHGVLIDIDDNARVIWRCVHKHTNDIDAEFCSLDRLLESKQPDDGLEYV